MALAPTASSVTSLDHFPRPNTSLANFPTVLLNQIKQYMDPQSKNVLKLTNIYFYTTSNKLFFQFQPKDLDSAFNHYLFLRPSKFLSYKDGQFKIRNLNLIQRVFRQQFGYYKDTHLKAVTVGCSIIASQSTLNITSNRDRAILKGIGEKISSKQSVKPSLGHLLNPNFSSYTNVQSNLRVTGDEQDLIGNLEVSYTRAYGIAASYGTTIRFILDITKEYVQFIVMDPNNSLLGDNNCMELGGCSAHAANDSILQHDHYKYTSLYKAAYKIAQSIATRAQVNIRVPIGLDPHIPDILTGEGFVLVSNRICPHWKWERVVLEDLPKVCVNLEFNW